MTDIATKSTIQAALTATVVKEATTDTASIQPSLIATVIKSVAITPQIAVSSAPAQSWG